MAEEQVILPEGYKRVEYIQSTGTQYINTGIVPDSNTGTYVKAICTGGGGSDNIDGASNRLMTPHIRNGNSAGYAYNGSWSGLDGRWIASEMFEGKLNFLNDGLYSLKQNNVDNSGNLPSVSFTNTYELYLCKPNGYLNYTGNWKIYSYRVSQGSDIIMDLIPCLDQNDIPCMYNTVNGETHYNQGTGNFITPRELHTYPELPINLPANYTKCAYLQSDGTQYIDTGVIPNDETGLYLKAQTLKFNDGIPFGCRDTTETHILYIPHPSSSAKNMRYAWETYVDTGLDWLIADDLVYTSSINLYNNRKVQFNSNNLDYINYLTTTLSDTIDTSLWLFSYNRNNEFESTYSVWGGRIYRAKITQGENLIHDFVPCLDENGIPCMYDLVSETPFYKAQGNEFAYAIEHQLPSDFIKLKYLKSTGTQYIKTGYIPTNNTGLYGELYNINPSLSSTVPVGMYNGTSNTYFFLGRVVTNKDASYGWGSVPSVGGQGNVIYESYLNYNNDKQSRIYSPAFADKINSLSDLPFTPSYDFAMFGINNNGTVTGSGYRIYRVKITENTTLVRDFVPAFDERLMKPCMYDLVNNVAYYNDGEGEFDYNRDFEGTYTGYGVSSVVGNRLGYLYGEI